MRKKLLSVLLCTAMAATMLTGCGGSDTKKDSSKEAKKVTVSDGGKVLNIRVWNEEFKSRMTDHYPGYKKVSDTEGKIGDVTVKWTITPSDDNAYQNALDEALKKQDSAAADDKIDLFLVEADYALKYVDTDYTLDVVNDLGVSKDALANQYKYTQDIVTDSKGALKGASWQACPAGMIYRRDIAKKVFKTDDPEKIQELFKDWDSFKAASKKLKDAGYLTTASVNDTYRVFSNNVTSKWVENKKINVDENIKAWVDMSKEMVDNGETTTHELWGSDWSEGFMKSGNVFAYFGPAWFIDFSMGYKDGVALDGSVVKDGGWALTTGPQSFYWGGTWICGANGTDNKSLVKDIIEKILPVVDSFERGLATVENPEEDPFADGMNKVYKQFTTALDELGVTVIEAVGKEFDPNLHNAVMHVEDEEAGENIVVEEFLKGYMYKGSVVRHSMVKVAN